MATQTLKLNVKSGEKDGKTLMTAVKSCFQRIESAQKKLAASFVCKCGGQDAGAMCDG